jgi:hypothetical protein
MAISRCSAHLPPLRGPCCVAPCLRCEHGRAEFCSSRHAIIPPQHARFRIWGCARKRIRRVKYLCLLARPLRTTHPDCRLAPTPHLDGKHTVFGRVFAGMKVVQRLGMVQCDSSDRCVRARVSACLSAPFVHERASHRAKCCGCASVEIVNGWLAHAQGCQSFFRRVPVVFQKGASGFSEGCPSFSARKPVNAPPRAPLAHAQASANSEDPEGDAGGYQPALSAACLRRNVQHIKIN